MEPDPLRAEWARWLAWIRRAITVGVVALFLVGVLVVAAMLSQVTRPVPPASGRDPRYTMTDYLQALDARKDTLKDTTKQS